MHGALDVDGRGFRIDTSGVSHTDGEVYIPHHFGEDNRWNLRNLHRFIILAVMEADKFQRGSFDVGRREPVRHRIDRGNNILFIVYFLKSVLVIGYPAPSFQYGNRFLRLDLVAGIAAGLSGFYFFRSRNVSSRNTCLKGWRIDLSNRNFDKHASLRLYTGLWGARCVTRLSVLTGGKRHLL
mgnify:CR=1 FL=1